MKKKFSLLFLLLISSFVYKDWFSFKLYSYSDYVYYPIESLLRYFPLSVWRSNFDLGGFDLLFWRMPQNIVYFLGAKIGLEFNVLDRIIVLWPWILLSSVCVYLLLDRHITSERAKITGASIFAFNTYFLSISTQGHLLISIASCLSILSICTFIRLLETLKFRYVVLTSILLSLTTIYDLRIWYVTSAILGAYLLFKIWVDKKLRKNLFSVLAQYFSIYFLYILMNIYWILPTLMSGGAVNQEILGRGLFGSEFLTILYSYSLFHPFWTGAQPAWFEVQKIALISWILPIFALLGFILGRKKSFIVFFGILAVIGIFFTKQVSIPFSGTYEWFFHHVPGFSAFREASKFYYLVALSYSVLIAYLLDSLTNIKYGFLKYSMWVVIGLIVLLLSLNVKPIVTKEIGSLFIERHIPDGYREFNKFISSQNNFFRVAWFPSSPWWRNATSDHPQLNFIDVLSRDWKNFQPQDVVKRYEIGEVQASDIGFAFFASPSAQQILSSASIKYLVLPISEPKRSDDVYRYYGRSEFDTYKSIKEIPYLKEINIGTGALKIFQLSEYKPHIYISKEKNIFSHSNETYNPEFNPITPTRYIIYMKNMSGVSTLMFTERYSPGWKIKIGSWKWYDGITGNKSNFTASEITELQTNGFVIDSQKICKTYPKECEVLDDGTYNFTMHLYYAPQSYFVIGLIVSVLTWAGVFLFVTFKLLLHLK